MLAHKRNSAKAGRRQLQALVRQLATGLRDWRESGHERALGIPA